MRSCSRCGNDFTPINNTQKFCGQTCREHPCPGCGKLTMNRSFCSSSCSVRVSNTTRIRTRRKPLHVCPTCGIETYNKKYCSTACHRVERYEILIPQWLSGEISGCGESGEALSFVRRWILERDGHKCSRCGWAEINPVTGKSPIAMDHIDGNHTNNRPENLRILCPNCHSLTPTYGSLNRGNGRPSRRRVKER